MLRKLALLPIGAVVIPESLPCTETPCKLQVIVTGKSPLLMTQETCAYSPSSKISLPNENGTIRGGSNQKDETDYLKAKLSSVKESFIKVRFPLEVSCV